MAPAGRLTKTIALAFVVLATTLALLLALTGCSSSPATLDGTHWKLVGWEMTSVSLTGVTITANFSAGKISGTSGVNSYGGPYHVGPGDAFRVGKLAVTLMAGPAPAMRAESAYLKLLVQAKSYHLADGTLTLCDKDGEAALTFAALAQ